MITINKTRSTQARKCGVISGCAFGILMMPVMFIGGLVLTIAVPFIGWVLGPMTMCCAVFLPFANIGALKGPCPVCGNSLLIGKAVTCGRCRHRIVRQGKRLVSF